MRVLPVILGLALLVGCGESGPQRSGSNTATQSATGEDATEICAKLVRRMRERLEKQHADDGTLFNAGCDVISAPTEGTYETPPGTEAVAISDEECRRLIEEADTGLEQRSGKGELQAGCAATEIPPDGE